MPAIEDWINSPLPIIQRLFGENGEKHAEKIESFFGPKIKSTVASGQLPSLNDVPTHNLATNSTVCFRASVQDMHDPEYYLGVYEVENVKNGQKYLKSGKYRDLAECCPNEEIKFDSSHNVTMDRQTFYCIPVPGETDWAKQLFAKQSGSLSNSAPSTSTTPDRHKRTLDEDDSAESSSLSVTPGNSNRTEDESMETETGNNPSEQNTENKKTKTDGSSESKPKDPLDLNFPLPGEKGPACLVKVYNCDDSIRLNDIVEIVGVLSNDPAMVSFPDSNKNEKSSFVDPDSGMHELMEETQAHNPPPSLVPRLHAISINKLTHNNPLLPQVQDDQVIQNIIGEASHLRSSLLSILKKLLFGDALVAEYLLCHIVSGVYARHDVVALGKFALNITGLPRNGCLPSLIHGVVKELVAKSHFLPMSLDNMNKLKFIPAKDYKANRLQTGTLQLCDKTHLVLDETALQPGQLDTNGVSNITALGNVITWQKADYDFNFHKQEFATDIVTLVLSEGKSILKCDCRVPLVANHGGFPENLEAHFMNILTQDLSSLELMNKLRAYIGLVQIMPYELSPDLQKDIEDDFVNTRKEDTSNMSVDDFHTLLVLARLLSLTHGEKTLSREIWERAKVLEVERKARLVLTSGDNSNNKK